MYINFLFKEASLPWNCDSNSSLTSCLCFVVRIYNFVNLSFAKFQERFTILFKMTFYLFIHFIINFIDIKPHSSENLTANDMSRQKSLNFKKNLSSLLSRKFWVFLVKPWLYYPIKNLWVLQQLRLPVAVRRPAAIAVHDGGRPVRREGACGCG